MWSTTKLLCWGLVVSAIRPRFAVLLLAFAVPAVLYDFIVGQSSLLAASLLGAILLTLDRRPIVSGFLIALLIFKPQYGVLLPLVLIATGRWTVFITASLVTPVLLLLTGLTFGWDTFEGSVRQPSSRRRSSISPAHWLGTNCRASTVCFGLPAWAMDRPWHCTSQSLRQPPCGC
ncbi:glycosyltransferase family 87 protein [Bradyrhizobium elkanii]|nr:glycosyltransferase family 87 protein [Bradyrhizobium elkanii]